MALPVPMAPDMGCGAVDSPACQHSHMGQWARSQGSPSAALLVSRVDCQSPIGSIWTQQSRYQAQEFPSNDHSGLNGVQRESHDQEP